MTFNQAKKLHNEDEVILKSTGEKIKILSIETLPYGYGTIEQKGTKLILVEGMLGEKYGKWDHTEIK